MKQMHWPSYIWVKSTRHSLHRESLMLHIIGIDIIGIDSEVYLREDVVAVF